MSGLDEVEAKDGGRIAAPAGGAGYALLYPPLEDIARRNRVAFVLLFAMVPLAGSALSVTMILLASWALISLVLRRFPLSFGRYGGPIVLSSLAFFAVLSAIDLALNPARDAVWNVLALLPYVMPLFLVPRMRVTAPADIMPAVFLGAGIGGTLLGPVVLAELLSGAPRVQALSGNPGPLSIVALLTAGLALLGIGERALSPRTLLAVAGAAGASFAVVLTGMRGAWPALPLVLLVAAYRRRRVLVSLLGGLSSRRRIALALGLAALLAAVVTLALPPVFGRIALFRSEFELLMADNQVSTSLSLRWTMYEASIRAFLAAPVLGYGMSGLWTGVAPFLEPGVFTGFSFSHLHNIVLTVAVAGGLAGLLALFALLCAPLVVALYGRRRPGGADRLAFALILLIAFVLPGLSNSSRTATATASRRRARPGSAASG